LDTIESFLALEIEYKGLEQESDDKKQKSG
jgi:hypothetical protein